MSRRILFAIRSKLGDTLISYACVRAYVDTHPHDRVTLLTRSAYARLLRAETGLRVIGFDNERGKGDHCHIGGKECPYLFVSVTKLIEDLIAAVDAARGAA